MRPSFPRRLAVGLVALFVAHAGRAAAVDPGSQLVTCDHADELLTLTASSHLDPSCTWTRGVEIVASDVTLDCQGARIAPTQSRRIGIYIHAPVDTPLANVTVRGCNVEGFLNNFHVEREGFRQLAAGAEYANGFSNIVIEDGSSLNSRGVGIFVDGYVEGVTLRRLHVEGSGSAGIYLEAGSRDNVVEDDEIVRNGYRENGPAGSATTFAGLDFWFWGTGREGLAIDGSRSNLVRNNLFAGNAAGGIFLYKNCGEYVTSRPDRWFQRRYGADANTIANNRFVDERNGVWIGSRMGENTVPMECSDPQYLPGYALDHAADDAVRDNTFENVTFGVRVEDDRATITGNQFTSADAIDEAIVVGTHERTTALAQPVDHAVITGNVANIAGSPNPFRWVWGETHTTFADNYSLGRLVSLCEGVQPPVGPFVMTVAFELLTDPQNPPNEVRELPLPAPLPPCRTACDAGAPLARARLAVTRLDTPPGDDILLLKGELVLPQPYAPALDPLANGVAVAIEDAAGHRPLDVALPAGAYDPARKAGWLASRGGTSWKYLDRSGAAPGGIVRCTVKDRSSRQPGLIEVSVHGRRGSYPVDPAALPRRALVVLDPPTAPTGQCGAAAFVAPSGACTPTANAVRCE